jgi:hypothetical protein
MEPEDVIKVPDKNIFINDTIFNIHERLCGNCTNRFLIEAYLYMIINIREIGYNEKLKQVDQHYVDTIKMIIQMIIDRLTELNNGTIYGFFIGDNNIQSYASLLNCIKYKDHPLDVILMFLIIINYKFNVFLSKDLNIKSDVWEEINIYKILVRRSSVMQESKVVNNTAVFDRVLDDEMRIDKLYMKNWLITNLYNNRLFNNLNNRDYLVNHTALVSFMLYFVTYVYSTQYRYIDEVYTFLDKHIHEVLSDK